MERSLVDLKKMEKEAQRHLERAVGEINIARAEIQLESVQMALEERAKASS
jgi:hypothetical protein